MNMMDATGIAVMGAACAIIGSGTTVIMFWMRFENRMTIAKAVADDAYQRAVEAKRQADDAHGRVTLLAAEFGLYRENVAREYIHREAMREIEDRLTAAIERLGDRLDTFMTRQLNAKANQH
jgi:hypothetical protein